MRPIQNFLTAILGLALTFGHAPAQTRGTSEPPPDRNTGQANGPEDQVGQRLGGFQDPVCRAIDADGNGEISAGEIDNAEAALRKLDENNDGQLTAEEVGPRARPGSIDGRSTWVDEAAGRGAEAAVVYGEPISSGHVILEGRVLLPPYRVGTQGRAILVNGERIAGLPGGRVVAGRQRQEGRSPWLDRLVANIEYWLFQDYAIIVFDERTRIATECTGAASFLRSLIEAESLAERIALAVEFEGGVSDSDETDRISTSQWREALARFHATDQPISQSEASLADWLSMNGEYEEEDLEQEAPASCRPARDRTAQRMYGLSVVGMVLIALSCGALLTHRPEFGQRWLDLVQSEAALSLVRRALTLIVALSAFDLACTLLAPTKGGFIEVNPVSESMLASPWGLSIFKIALTIGAVGILWSLRRRAGSQQASWWLCLILTLVTARWVALQSLFFV